MFRRLPHTLPADPVYEPDLEKLGFFVTEQDQIRQINNPAQKYQYRINRNERWNDVYKGANNAAVHKIVLDRFADLGMETVRLPLGASEKENHVPILVSKDIANKERVVVFFGERNVVPGILSWRTLGADGIERGSLLGFAKAVLSGPPPVDGAEAPGLVIANPCQLLWYRGGARAVSSQEWMCLPRPSAVHEPPRIDEVGNRIPGNRDYEEHIAYIFEKVLGGLVKQTAMVDVVGIEYSVSAAVEYLATHWNSWSSRISGICLINPQHKIQDLIERGAPGEFTTFFAKRCRAYFVSESPIEAPTAGREMFGCNCYSSGEASYQDNAMLKCWRHILDWFSRLYASPDYEEAEFINVAEGKDMEQINLGWG